MSTRIKREAGDWPRWNLVSNRNRGIEYVQQMPKSQALDPLLTTSYGGQAIRLAKTFAQVGKLNELFLAITSSLFCIS